MNYSKQRDSILSYIRSVKIHPTAETIYNTLKQDMPNISLGTVYRNLDKMEKSGEVLRIKLADAKDRFDGDINHHYHGICDKCGSIQDIFIDYFNNIDNVVIKKSNFNVVNHEILFHIICPNCSKI